MSNSDPLDLPIDHRLPPGVERGTLRELIAYEMGGIKENQARAALDRHDQNRQIMAMSKDVAEVGRLVAATAAKVDLALALQHRETIALAKIVDGGEEGLLHRVARLERRDAQQRNFIRGAVAVASLVSALVGALLAAALSWFKRG